MAEKIPKMIPAKTPGKMPEKNPAKTSGKMPEKTCKKPEKIPEKYLILNPTVAEVYLTDPG